MTIRSLLFVLMSFALFACNAYRQKPESEISFTRQDLTRKGFVLAPIAVPDPSLNPGASELLAYDVILGNTLLEKWKNVSMLASPDIARMASVEDVETWREALSKEEPKDVSSSTLAMLRKLTSLGKSYPKQVLLPTLLQNAVSCGQKEAVSSYLSERPHGERKYCQRVVKMRFRIMSVERSELLWNGLIYATQESAEDLKAFNKERDITPPSTQALIRECFNNFQKQFSER